MADRWWVPTAQGRFRVGGQPVPVGGADGDSPFVLTRREPSKGAGALREVFLQGDAASERERVWGRSSGWTCT